MNYFKRETYLNKIRGFYNDTDIIKVITGGCPSLRKILYDVYYCR